MTAISSVKENFDTTTERFDSEKYQSRLSPDSHYAHVPNEMLDKVKAPLAERIRWVRDIDGGKRCEWLIDSAIRVEGPAEALLKCKASQWKKIQTDRGARADWALYIGLGSLAIMHGSLLLYPLCNPTKTIVFFTTASTISLLASGVFMATECTRAGRASDEVSRWSNASRVQEMASLRTQAYEDEFPHIYLDYPKGILHPLEMETLYEKYFQKFCKNRLSSEPNDKLGYQKWLKDFHHENPFNFRSNVPEHMKAAIKDYEWLHSAYEAFSSTYLNLKGFKNKNWKEQIDALTNSYEQKRDKLLKIEEINYNIEVIRTLLDKSYRLLNPFLNDEARREIKKKYQAIQDSCKANFIIKSIELHKKCQQKIETAGAKLDEQFEIHYYSAAREFLTRAERAWNGETYQPMDFKQYFPWLKIV